MLLFFKVIVRYLNASSRVICYTGRPLTRTHWQVFLYCRLLTSLFCLPFAFRFGERFYHRNERCSGPTQACLPRELLSVGLGSASDSEDEDQPQTIQPREYNVRTSSIWLFMPDDQPMITLSKLSDGKPNALPTMRTLSTLELRLRI